jgi:hypothetical protein
LSRTNTLSCVEHLEKEENMKKKGDLVGLGVNLKLSSGWWGKKRRFLFMKFEASLENFMGFCSSVPVNFASC